VPGSLSVEPHLMSQSVEPTNELYSSITQEVRQELAGIARVVTLSKGTKLLSHGAKPKQVILLDSGSVEITMPSEGKTFALGSLGPGKVIGLRAVVAGEVSEVEVTAIENCEVTLLDGDEFLAVLRRHPQVYLAVAKILSADLRNADEYLRQKASALPRAVDAKLLRS
jgi:CRP/FNR family transcriptional regulator, cyclic AMP receptor protein